jgi:hypothetical protein
VIANRCTLSLPYGGTHLFAPSMDGCEVERCFTMPATDDFAPDAIDQHVRVLDSQFKFSSR